jgi:hypothetical protein
MDKDLPGARLSAWYGEMGPVRLAAEPWGTLCVDGHDPFDWLVDEFGKKHSVPAISRGSVAKPVETGCGSRSDFRILA